MSRGASYRRWSGRKFRVILDASDAEGVLCGDTQGSALILRSDDTPEMHDPVRDDDAAFAGIRPLLLAQLGEQLAADRAVLLRVSGFGSAAG